METDTGNKRKCGDRGIHPKERIRQYPWVGVGGPNEVEISNLPEEFKVMIIKIFTELRKKSGETQ